MLPLFGVLGLGYVASQELSGPRANGILGLRGVFLDDITSALELKVS